MPGAVQQKNPIHLTWNIPSSVNGSYSAWMNYSKVISNLRTAEKPSR